MLYCLSDTHLSFTTDKPMNVFGRTWERHEERIKENWINTELIHTPEGVRDIYGEEYANK